MIKLPILKTTSALLASVVLCTTVAAIKPPVTASAASIDFITDTNNNGALNIDESQIKVSSRSYYNTGASFSMVVSDNVIQTKNSENYLPILDRRKITIRVTGTESPSDILDRLTNIDLNATFSYEGKTGFSRAFSNPQVSYYGMVNGRKCYELTYELMSYGSKFSFNLDKINFMGTLSCVYADMSPMNNGISYTIYTVDSPGEDVIISLRNDSSIPYKNIEAWGKRLCLLANSLSQMTGVKRDQLFVAYDVPDVGLRASETAYIHSDQSSRNAIAVTNAEFTDYDLKRLRSDKNELVWGLIHEISHCYCCKSSSHFNDHYNFVANGLWDDYVTNLRGLTAMQNCDNLRQTSVYYEPDGSSKSYCFRYNSITDNLHSSDLRYQFMQKMGVLANKKYGNQTGWEKLEEYFAAKTDYNCKTTENKRVAKAVNELLGTNYSLYDENYLMFVNSFRTLYLLTNGKYYGIIYTNEINDFKNFLTKNFGDDYLRKVANSFSFKLD